MEGFIEGFNEVRAEAIAESRGQVRDEIIRALRDDVSLELLSQKFGLTLGKSKIYNRIWKFLNFLFCAACISFIF